MTDKIQQLAFEIEPRAIEYRHALHSMAELSGKEYRTSAFIREKAEALGLSVENVSETGLIVTLDTGKAGNSVALRADIDALPIEEPENNMTRKRTCRSQTNGVMHACGHDAHTASLICAMELLNSIKSELCGKIFFCFESGEENMSGWPAMVAALEQKDINAVYAHHVSSALDSGKISVDPGPRMGGTIGVGIVVHGRGGHGSRPDLSINPVFCAASIVTNLAAAFANQISANETVTLGITSIDAGMPHNVFADTATIKGSFRFFSRTEGEKALGILRSVAEHTAAMNNCTIEYLPITALLVDVTINDDDAAGFAREQFKNALGEQCVVSVKRWFGSETFSEYLRRWKGAFGFVGVRNKEEGCFAEHHNRFFDLDESSLKYGVFAYAKFAAAAVADPDIANWKYKL